MIYEIRWKLFKFLFPMFFKELIWCREYIRDLTEPINCRCVIETFTVKDESVANHE
jgi:hypothetical protein